MTLTNLDGDTLRAREAEDSSVGCSGRVILDENVRHLAWRLTRVRDEPPLSRKVTEHLLAEWTREYLEGEAANRDGQARGIELVRPEVYPSFGEVVHPALRPEDAPKLNAYLQQRLTAKLG